MWHCHHLAAAALCVMIATAGAKETALCYRLSYGKRDSKGRYEHNEPIKPITTFPKFHSVVKERVCDKFNEGDRIPGTKFASAELAKDPGGFNPETFAQKFNRTKIPRWVAARSAAEREGCNVEGSDDMDCIDRKRGYANCNPRAGYMNSGALWYGYDFPKASSANTGYEETKIGKFYFISDSDHDGWLVVVFDSSDNIGGGAVEFTLEIETEEPAFIAARDDPNACAVKTHYTTGNIPAKACEAISGNFTCKDFNRTAYVKPVGGSRDCFAWEYDNEKKMGAGSFNLAWNSYKTDGLVFGPIADSSFTAQIKFQKIQGLTGFKVGNYDAKNSTLGFVPLTSDEMFLGFQIEGSTCDSYCDLYGTDCAACFRNKQCGFCNQNSQCMGAKESDKCAWGWVPWVASDVDAHGAKCYKPRPTTTNDGQPQPTTTTTTTKTSMPTSTTSMPISTTETTTTTTTTKTTTAEITSTAGTATVPIEETDCALRPQHTMEMLSAELFVTVIILSLF